MMTPKSGISSAGKSYHYYQCTKNTHLGKRACNATCVPAKSIEDFAVERVKELTTEQDKIKKMISRANKKGNQKIQKLIDDKKSLSRQIQVVKEKLSSIVDYIETGSVNAFNSLNERIDSLENEREEFEGKLTSLSVSPVIPSA